MKEVTRRKFLGTCFGLAGILAGMPRITSPEEQYGLKEFKAYVVAVHKEAKKMNSTIVFPTIFKGIIDDKELDIHIFEERYNYIIEIDYLKNNKIIKSFFDSEIKGNLLGLRDRVSFLIKNSVAEEYYQFHTNGKYFLSSMLKYKNPKYEEKCEDNVPIGYTKSDYLCFAGQAFYDPEGMTKPILKGIYRTIGHQKLKERGKKEIKKANKEYKILLPAIIKKLEKDGKLEVKK